MTQRRNNLLYYLALLFAAWFLVAGSAWAYGAALFMAYPFGILALILWRRLRRAPERRHRWILYLLIAGFALSMGALVTLLLTN